VYEPSSSGSGRAALMIALVVIAAVAGAGGTYYLTRGAAPVAAATNTVTSTSVSTTTVSVQSGTEVPANIDAVQIYQEANRSVVTVDGFIPGTKGLFGLNTGPSEVLGSGFVYNYQNANYVITNDHVVDGATNMTVIFGNGDAYPATVVGTDPYSDLAVVKAPSAPGAEFYPLTISSSSSVQVGDPVAAIGNPFGLSGSLTVGVVSQLGRTIQEQTAGNYSIAGVIQFSAPINPGNSGGPLFNANGQVVGLTTATVSGSQGVGFAIPSDAVTRELPSLISTGQYDEHPYIGVSTADMFYQLSQANGNTVTYGVLVESVVQGGPADKAGIKGGGTQVTVEGNQYLTGGDVIVSINGTRIVNHDALASYLEQYAQVGHTLSVGIMRGATPMTVSLTVAARPPIS
jgi:S1-C subfamily serine protease